MLSPFSILGFILPGWTKLAAVGAVILALFTWHKLAVYNAGKAGYDTAIKNVESANRQSGIDADASENGAVKCHHKGGDWNRSTGKCVLP